MSQSIQWPAEHLLIGIPRGVAFRPLTNNGVIRTQRLTSKEEISAQPRKPSTRSFLNGTTTSESWSSIEKSRRVILEKRDNPIEGPEDIRWAVNVLRSCLRNKYCQSIAPRFPCAAGLVGSDVLNNVKQLENEHDDQTEHRQPDQCL